MWYMSPMKRTNKEQRKFTHEEGDGQQVNMSKFISIEPYIRSNSKADISCNVAYVVCRETRVKRWKQADKH